MDSALLSQRELARRWRLSERTLEGMRQRRYGSPFIKLGKAAPPRPCLMEQWVAAHTIDPANDAR